MASMGHTHRARAVFLDRDGVLNRAFVRDGKPHPPAGASELEILPGVIEACAALRSARFKLLVVTNQPDIGRGTQDRATVEAINDIVREKLQLDDVRICPHDDDDGCACRKPAPGLLFEAARDWDVVLEKSVIVGDRWRDIECGKRAGCKTVFIDYRYAEKRPDGPDLTVKSLAEAVPWILRTLLAQERPPR
jgi:D-glycero-D-manno-heptose 1,7-bisphosphate phosphatase